MNRGAARLGWRLAWEIRYVSAKNAFNARELIIIYLNTVEDMLLMIDHRRM